MGKIKQSNFHLGESQNEYKSSFGEAFGYNQDKANKGRGVLDQDKIIDLKATHYTLGKDNNNFATSTGVTYLPTNVAYFQRYDNKSVKQSSIDFESQTNIRAEDRLRSSYMVDYKKKSIEE